MKSRICILFLTFVSVLFSQSKKTETPFVAIDSLYREDQFFLGITYNTLVKIPKDFAQNGLSLGVNAGFLRDFPLNKNRTFAFAIGLGATYNKYHQNILVSKQNGVIVYELIENQIFDRNKLEQVTIDIPFEIRWRTSTAEKHQFFRIYTGFKVGYLVFNKTKYVGEIDIQNIVNSSDFNKLQFGPTLSVGYNTWNFHAYYGLNPIFDNAMLNGQNIQMSNLNLGLIFYIL